MARIKLNELEINEALDDEAMKAVFGGEASWNPFKWQWVRKTPVIGGFAKFCTNASDDPPPPPPPDPADDFKGLLDGPTTGATGDQQSRLRPRNSPKLALGGMGRRRPLG